jgi:hypothetical protein
LFVAKKSKDVEKNRILESREQELKEYLKRQNGMTDQIAELSIEKEQLLGEISALTKTRHPDGEDDEKKSLKKEIEVPLLCIMYYILCIIIICYVLCIVLLLLPLYKSSNIKCLFILFFKI